jgi:monoamine oxidase
MAGMTDFNRRQVLGAGTATAAVSALPVASLATTRESQFESDKAVDVVVVGAGFAGLTAAISLARAGRSVLVLEASDRVGGRTKAAELAGHTVDVGGQWVGPTQTALLGLAKRYGAHIEPQFADGANILDIAGTTICFTGDMPSLADADLLQFGKAIEALDSAAAGLDPRAPWASPGAIVADRLTSLQWFKTNVQSQIVIDVLSVFWRGVFSVEPSQISHLYALEYIRAAGGVSQLIGTRGGAQDATFKGGVYAIARAMARELGQKLRLKSPISRIEQNSSGVSVHFEGETVTASHVVLACAPSARAKINFSPVLPALYRHINDRMPLGGVIKFLIAYASPFWRARGLSGQVIATEGPIKLMFDKSLPGGMGGLVGFFNGADAARAALFSKADRKRLVIAQAVKHLGAEAADPIDYVDNDWLDEPWIGGGYTSVPGPDVYSISGSALRNPHGRLHFAGTETSEVWPGYIEGAVRSGERVAAEVLAKLKI